MTEPAFTLEVRPDGRVQLPAGLRTQLGLAPGSRLIVRVRDEGHAELITAEALAHELQGVLAVNDGRSLSEELVQERHAEAERE